MSDTDRTVPMYLVDPGTTSFDGTFAFEMQAQTNAGRTVRFSLSPQDAELLHRHLGVYLKAQRK